MDDKNVNNIESKLNENKKSSKKVILVDTIGTISYSLIMGSIIDYRAGLNLTGIIASRTSGTIVNTFTGGAYGWWREKASQLTKTNKESSYIKKSIVDILAFNTFQMPIYAALVAFGSYVSEGKVDMDKVQKGATELTLISPFIGPTMGLYVDGCR